jgi:hypothetical protein
VRKERSGGAIGGGDFHWAGFLIERTDGKEFVAAGFTAQGGETQETACKRHHARNVRRRNFLEIEIAADAAVRVEQVAEGQRAGMEAGFAFLTPPGDDANEAEKMVLEASAPGPATVGGTAEWAVYLQVQGMLPGTNGGYVI